MPSVAGSEAQHGDGVQVSRRVGLVHHEDLLDHASSLPANRWRDQETLQKVQAGGALPGAAGANSHISRPQKVQEKAPQAEEEAPGSSGEVAELLWLRPRNRVTGHGGTKV